MKNIYSYPPRAANGRFVKIKVPTSPIGLRDWLALNERLANKRRASS